MHVIVFDDFLEDLVGVYRRACEFLAVDPEFSPEIEVVNPNKRVRSRMVRRMVQQPPEGMRKVVHGLTTVGMRRRVGGALKRRNTIFHPRAPISDASRKALLPDVERQVAELDDLIGLDVSGWLD